MLLRAAFAHQRRHDKEWEREERQEARKLKSVAMIDDLAAEAKEFNECHSAAYAIGQGIDRMAVKLKAAMAVAPIEWTGLAERLLTRAGHDRYGMEMYRLNLALVLKNAATEYLATDCPLVEKDSRY